MQGISSAHNFNLKYACLKKILKLQFFFVGGVTFNYVPWVFIHTQNEAVELGGSAILHLCPTFVTDPSFCIFIYIHFCNPTTLFCTPKQLPWKCLGPLFPIYITYNCVYITTKEVWDRWKSHIYNIRVCPCKNRP